MKKKILAGLTALVLNCNPVSFTSTDPFLVYPPQAMHRGVPLTGMVYRDIQIIGPVDYTQRMKHSLDRVSQTPFWYFIHDNLTAIRFQPPSKVHVGNGIFDSDDNTSTGKKHQPEAWIDSELVHEACHVHLYRSGRETWGYNAEKECIAIQNVYLTQVGATNLLIDVEARLQERYWDKKDQWW